jgi:hypothetical protein
MAGVLFCLPCKAGEATHSKVVDSPAREYAPTEDYDVQQIEGWRILVHKDFPRSEPDIHRQTLKLLDHHLFAVAREVPAAALSKLQRITIWVELNEPHHPCMAYHPDAGWLREHDMNPDKAGCVEIANARKFLAWTHDQPSMVLHELAHGYHDRFLARGFGNPEIAAALKKAKDDKLYEAVLHCRGRTERAYAMNNPMEYFAETTEAFFGTNDFFPFVRVELQKHDPGMHDLLKKLWEVK